MKTETPAKNFYAVLESEVLFDKNLSCRQKILIAMISNMSNQKGYCWASNQYFADSLDVSSRAIRYDLEYLEEKKFIGRIIQLDSKGEESFRTLTVLNSNPAASSIVTTKKKTRKPTITSVEVPISFTDPKEQVKTSQTEIDLLWLTLKSIYTPNEDKGINNNIAIRKQKKVLSNFSKEEQDFIIKLFTKYKEQLGLDNPWLSNFFNARPTIKEVADYFREIKDKKPQANKTTPNANKWIGDFSNL